MLRRSTRSTSGTTRSPAVDGDEVYVLSVTDDCSAHPLSAF